MSSGGIERICDDDGHGISVDEASGEISAKDESQEVDRIPPPRHVDESNDEESNIISSDDLDEAIKQVLDDSLDSMPISSAAYKSGNKAGRKVVATKGKAVRNPRARLTKAALQKSRAPDGGSGQMTAAIKGSAKAELKKKKKAKTKKEDGREQQSEGEGKKEENEETRKESEGGGEKSSSTPGSEGSTLEMKSEEDDGKKEDGKEGHTGPVTGQLGSVSPAQRVLVLCRRGDWYAVDQALRNVEKFEPGLLDENTGYTPVMYAVKDNRVNFADKMIDMGIGVNVQSKDGLTALHLACIHVKEDIVKMLLQKKADPLITGGDKDQLPLHMICTKATGAALSILQTLLKVTGPGARMLKDKEGAIPLLLATETKNQGICKELIQNNFSEQMHYFHPKTGDSAIHLATRKRDVGTVKIFLEAKHNINAKNFYGQTPLHIASKNGDETMAKIFFHHHANPNAVDNDHKTPLHVSAEAGSTNIVDLLTDKFKASVFERTKDGSTLIHIASENGHPETAMVFLRKGVPLHMPNKAGARCIHIAAERGHVEVVRALLMKGENVDTKTNDNHTALHIAVKHCRPLVVELLLGYGAQVHLKAGETSETPLHIAARVKNGEKCAEMLLKSGCDVNSAQLDGETALHFAARCGHLKTTRLLLDDGALPSIRTNEGLTPLHMAVNNCKYEVVRELLDLMESRNDREAAEKLVNLQTSDGKTAIHYAAAITKKQCSYENEDIDMIRLLLEYRGNVNLQTSKSFETPLHFCAQGGNVDVLKEIVAHMDPHQIQISINKQAKNGMSSLMMASEKGHLDVVTLLLQEHARVDVFDENGRMALHLAAENGHIEAIDVLLAHKAFVNAKSKSGITPLHLAALKGYSNLVMTLVEKFHAVIDALTIKKRTPLHCAAESGQLEVCKMLLDMKADNNSTDVYGQTPLHLAAENDHSDVVKLFLYHCPELSTMANTKGFTCAHIAAMKGSVGVIKELMKFNMSVVTSAKTKEADSTTLHLAAEGGHADVVKALLEAGAAPDEENSDGLTAIHLAAKFGHVEVLDALRPAMDTAITSKKSGFTALHVAANFGQTEFVREILTEIPATCKSEPPLAEPNADAALTPLHLSAKSGYESVVRLLLNSAGVQADARTSVNGMTPLHYAAQGGHVPVVGLLLSKSTSQLHLKDTFGRTGLHLATEKGHYDMVALLIGQGADINAADNNGWTALHYTAKAGYLPVIKLLCDSGALPSCGTKDGKIPLCLAAAANHYDVLNYLVHKDHNTDSLLEDKSFVFTLMSCGKIHEQKPIEEFVLLSPAPLETAVKLARSFYLLSFKEKERSKDLISAAKHCESMSSDLLSIASSACTAGKLMKSIDTKGTLFLDALIELEQKEVVSHPAVQRYLTEVWMGSLNWGAWKIVLLFLVFLFCPPVWIVMSLPLGHRFAHLPIIKFMSYLASHIFLIVLMTITNVIVPYKIWESTHLIPHWYEWLLLIWLSGILVSELMNPGDRAGLGWIKVIILGLSAIAITIHCIGFFFSVDIRRHVLYIRNQLLSLGLLLCFLELLNFLSFHHLFGPWAIIIRDLMKDLLRFLVILSIFLLGFSYTVAAIYQPIHPIIEDDSITAVYKQKTILQAFEMLFFSLFGLVDPDTLPPLHYSPEYSVYLMKGVFGVYMTVTVVVLINLLIAMMSDTYQRIQAESDTEWKFGRAKLIRNMNKTSPTPSPMNLLTVLPLYFHSKMKQRNQQGKFFRQALSQYNKSKESNLEAGHSTSNKSWMKLLSSKKNNKITPLELLSMTSISNVGPQPIKQVVEWKLVVTKYLEFTGKILQGYEIEDQKDQNQK